MTIPYSVIFQTLLDTSSAPRQWGGYSTRGLLWATALVRHSQWLQAWSDSRLTLTPTSLDPHMGICIYHFITPMISDQPCDCFYLFTLVRPVQRNLWLTARSSVNMQHLFSALLAGPRIYWQWPLLRCKTPPKWVSWAQ